MSHSLPIFNSGYISPDKAIEIVNQIYDISKAESVSRDQLPDYVRQKQEEKQKIDEEIQQAKAAKLYNILDLELKDNVRNSQRGYQH